MAAYLDLPTFKTLTLMPASDVDALESLASGWIGTQLEYYSRWIDSRLRKRYAVPFPDPAPEAVREWLNRIVTMRAFLRRGVDPNDAQFAAIVADRDAALADIKEAADSETGLFELPLLDASDASDVSKGGPYAYSEQSPYVWTDVQRDAAFDEDSNRSGTGG